MEELVLFEIQGPIAVIRINRPKALNALSKEIVDLIDDKLELINKNKEIKVLIVTGDKNFAAGADIVDMVEKNKEEARAFAFSETFSKLESIGMPTIAAICGYALGGGLELALACDLRIASEDAQVGLPEINLGIMPGAGGTVRLPRLIGEAKAKELIYLGGRLPAHEAYQFGIVNKVVKNEELMDEAFKMAGKLAEKSVVAIKAAKKSINSSSEMTKTDAIKNEAELWSGLFDSQDQKEGMRAFIEKRKPNYQGK
jgi:enoyl-CoA hydratase/carnithine racemase